MRRTIKYSRRNTESAGMLRNRFSPQQGLRIRQHLLYTCHRRGGVCHLDPDQLFGRLVMVDVEPVDRLSASFAKRLDHAQNL